jgi:hypothetical protein
MDKNDLPPKYIESLECWNCKKKLKNYYYECCIAGEKVNMTCRRCFCVLFNKNDVYKHWGLVNLDSDVSLCPCIII